MGRPQVMSREEVEALLAAHDWQVPAAAAAIDVEPDTLYARVYRHGIRLRRDAPSVGPVSHAGAADIIALETFALRVQVQALTDALAREASRNDQLTATLEREQALSASLTEKLADLARHLGGPA
jgi:hypothetical protein